MYFCFNFGIVFSFITYSQKEWIFRYLSFEATVVARLQQHGVISKEAPAVFAK